MKVSMTAAGLMAAGGLLVGLVIASPSVTMAEQAADATAQTTPTVTETPAPEPKETPAPAPKEESGSGSEAPDPKPGHLVVRWDGDSLDATWKGSCDSPITVKVGQSEWGHLSEPKNGLNGIGGTTSSILCESGSSGGGIAVSMSDAVCYGFTQAWIQVDGKTEDAGLKVIDIPSTITCKN